MIQLKNKKKQAKFYKTQPYKYSTHVQVQAQKKVWKDILRLLRYITSWEINHVCIYKFSTVQSLSHVWLFATPWTEASQASLPITNFRSPPKTMYIESVMPSNHLILSSPSPAFNLSQHQGLFKWVRWPKYWSFSFNISLANEYSGLISFRMEWLDLLAVQGTLKSLLQHHSSKASVLQHSAFFLVRVSHAYMITGNTIDLTRWTLLQSNVSAF